MEYEKLDWEARACSDPWDVIRPGFERIEDLNIKLARLLSADDVQLYIRVVRTFLATNTLPELQQCFAQKEWTRYRHVMGILKCNLKQIGAEELSNTARKLELAAKHNDIDAILARHEKLMVSCQSLMCALEEILPEDDCAAEERVQTEQAEVLMVDNDAVNLVAARHALSPYFDIAWARSGHEAIEYLRSNTPDMILLAAQMEDMSGLDVLKELGAESRTRNIPVMVWAVKDDEMTELKCLKAGVDDFVRKPCVPDILMHRVYRTLETGKLKSYMHRQMEKSSVKVDSLSIQIMVTLARTIDAKDPYTKGHSDRVAKYSSRIAKKLGLSAEEQSRIYYIALLHDIGKIGVPDQIIGKPGRLTDEEYEAVKKHPVIGYEILKELNEIQGIEQGARWHHERIDGTGYPDGLQGKEIPLFARIISVADSYDAMNSRRSYRYALHRDEIIRELENGKGTQFDAQIAQAAVEMIRDQEI